MKSHKFDVEDAKKYGVEKAIILEHIKYHQESNTGYKDAQFSGKSYAFLKADTIKKMYPYFNYKSVNRWLRELEEDGVIESVKPRAKFGEHLKYYRVIKHNLPISQNENSISQNGTFQISQNENSSISTNVKNPMQGAGVSLNEKTEAEYQRYKEYMKKEKGRHVGLFQEEEQRLFLSKCRDPIGVIKRSISNGWMKLVEEEKEPETQSRYEYF